MISRTSVMAYRDTDKNMRTIGDELGVATILEGGVQRAGNTVRINVQLIDTETDEHLWAEIYDRELTAENIFEIQSEMAMFNADALQATLSPQEVARLNTAPTSSTRAYDLYLSGKDYFHRPADTEFLELALQQYERAVEQDPEFALAWASLSRAHTLMHWFALDRTDARLELAREAVERAFELEPDLPEAHLAMAQFYFQGLGDYDAAVREIAIAERNMSGNADLYQLRAYVFRRVPDFERALADFDRAIELDPRSVDLLVQQARTYVAIRDGEFE